MYFRATKKQSAEISLSEPIDSDKDGNNLSLVDILKSDDDIEHMVGLKLESQKLYQSVEHCLSPREREILILRYGLYGKHPMPQREIAKQMGISRSYVSRIEKKAVEILRHHFLSDGSST